MFSLARVFAVLCLSLALSISADAAAPTYDNASGATCSNCTSLTWAHTTGGGSNRAILVGGTGFDTGDSITGITYNAVGLSAIASASAANANYKTSQYGLAAPATGTNNVVISVTGQMADLSGCAVTVSDADQTTPFVNGNNATGTGTVPSVTITASTDMLVVDSVIIIHGGTFSVGAGQTSRCNAIGGSGFSKYGGSTEPGASSVVMDWSNTASQTWATAGSAIQGIVAAASVPLQLLLGVGQ